MPKEPLERYLDWLEREEERVGIGATVGASVDVEAARRLLYDELGYDPTESQLASFQEIGMTKYERFPEVGISVARYERTWGYQSVFRDTATGQFTSYTIATERIATFY